MSSDGNGQAFSCTCCGECCRGKGGIVLDERDQERLSAHMGMTVSEFLDRYTETRGYKPHLRVGDDEYCVFHHNELCSVHEARPDICRAWPFFRGNLVDAVSWELAQDYCPGLNSRVSHKEFTRQGATYLRDNDLASRSGPDRPEALRVDIQSLLKE
ncbi:MAG: YkgJ family cysteine cluster protein [Desulfovibrio sp.]|nr:MAG: YkgJ family cysteine cluster protein [Desulfovibrio sp.]